MVGILTSSGLLTCPLEMQIDLHQSKSIGDSCTIAAHSESWCKTDAASAMRLAILLSVVALLSGGRQKHSADSSCTPLHGRASWVPVEKDDWTSSPCDAQHSRGNVRRPNKMKDKQKAALRRILAWTELMAASGTGA